MSLQDLVSRDDLRVFIYATGAGAGIQNKIWNTVGCSSFFVGSSFPYSNKLSSKALGYTPAKFVSESMSVDLAMQAYIQAYEPGKKAIGIGLTSSVASLKEHRGDHQIFVSAFSDDGCFTLHKILTKGSGTEQRFVDGKVADDLAIDALLGAVNKFEYLQLTYSDIQVKDNGNFARSNLLDAPFFDKHGNRFSNKYMSNDNIVYYPGNFNPIHHGHLSAAEAVLDYIADTYGQRCEVIFTTIVNPPHKEPLTTAEMLQRATLLQGHNFCLTEGDPMYIDKARRHPGASFIIGADALIRMLDPKWGTEPNDLLKVFYKLNTKFFVLGRLVEHKFINLFDIQLQFPILDKYSTLFESVPGRWDISSTEIRNK